jgi:spermidine synthase
MDNSLPAEGPSASRLKMLVFYFIFFCSGASALTFETLWFRQAGLTFGNSVWAGSMVLASFMAGLALGNLFAGKYGHKSKQPIRAYGKLEFLIGAFGLGLVLLFPEFNARFAPLFEPYLDQPLILNPLRLGLGFALMLPATMAMGATLPFMIRGLSAQNSQFGVRLGRLYALNTMGAMAGTLICEMVLIEKLGIRGTGYAAAGLNVFVGLTAILAGKIKPISAPAPEISKSTKLTGPQKRILCATFLAGGILLALEVVWFRYLLLLNFGTSQVFAVMLAVVLAGISIGGVLASLWLRKRDAWQSLSMAAVCSGLLTLICYAIPTILIVKWNLKFKTDVTGLSTLGHSMIVMFPVSILSGALFTMMGSALHANGTNETKTAGYLTLFNTTGAMFGAILGGFCLIPMLGIERSILWLSFGYVIVSALCWIRWADMKRVSRWSTTLMTVLLVGITLGYPRGVTDNALFFKVAGVQKDRTKRVVALREGLTETIMYSQSEWMGHPLYHQLITNSHSMSGTSPAAWQYMKMYVYLPIAMHSAPRKSLLISYGCGVTGKALTDTKELTQIDIVDISRDILDLNRVVFPDADECPLNDPRVRVFIEDGRFFLQTTKESYDLITSEPPPPKGANVVNLYTQEYFQLIHDRLAPGGMTSYWLPHHSLNQQDSRTIVRAFCEVFKDSSLWLGSGDNWMLLGIRDGHKPVTEERFRNQWQDADVAPILTACGFEFPEQMGSYFIGDRDFMMEFTEGTLPLADNFPYRMKPSTSTRETESRYAELMDADASKKCFETCDHIARTIPKSLIKPSLPYFDQRNYIHDLWASRRVRFNPVRVGSMQGLHMLQSKTQLTMPVLWSLNTGYRDQLVVDKIVAENRTNIWVIEKLGHRGLASRDYAAAETRYAECLQKMEKNSVEFQQNVLRQTYVLCMQGKQKEAQACVDTHLPKLQDEDLNNDWAYLKSTFELADPTGEIAKR